MEPTQPTRPRISEATTFRTDEVELMMQLLALVARGGDARILARQPAFATVRAKFAKMHARLSGRDEA